MQMVVQSRKNDFPSGFRFHRYDHQGERFYQIPRVCCDGTGLFDVIYTYCIVKGLEKKMKDKTIVTAFRPVVTETE